jgi:ribosomal-protein-alanine N-acetyltransferase
MKAPERIETARLRLHRPTANDLDAIFIRYASDPEVTRFVAWPRHTSLVDTRSFFQFSEAEWGRWPAGPYLVRSRADDELLGSAGLALDSESQASTGYVLAKDAWGRGFASEILQAMVNLARDLGIRRLYAICHTEHRASSRVLEKAGFLREKVLHREVIFPNLASDGPADVYCYAINLVEAHPSDEWPLFIGQMGWEHSLIPSPNPGKDFLSDLNTAR